MAQRGIELENCQGFWGLEFAERRVSDSLWKLGAED